jgi:proline iminopeptidase
VFVYDRLGAGRSERLADPRGYGLPRDVADLEAARQAMGARRLILIGQDHGAQLATAYLAEHPSQVTRTVLAAPAALDGPRAASPGLSLATPTRGLPSPRLLAVYTLLRANPQAAHAFAGDRELEAADVRGYATLAPRTTLADLPEGLSTATAPALIVRGLRQDWSQLAAYRAALPRAELVSLPDGSYRGKPYLQLLRAFLAGKPLPVNGGDAPRG